MKPHKDIVSLRLRLSKQLHMRLKLDAKRNNRSLNKEMVHRLGLTYGEEGAAMIGYFDEIKRQMWNRLQAIIRRIER